MEEIGEITVFTIPVTLSALELELMVGIRASYQLINGGKLIY